MEGAGILILMALIVVVLWIVLRWIGQAIDGSETRGYEYRCSDGNPEYRSEYWRNRDKGGW